MECGNGGFVLLLLVTQIAQVEMQLCAAGMPCQAMFRHRHGIGQAPLLREQGAKLKAGGFQRRVDLQRAAIAPFRFVQAACFDGQRRT